MKAGLDIGNTRSKLGLYHEDGTIEMMEIERSPDAIFDKIMQYEIDGLVVSSVSGELVDDARLMKSLKTFIFLTHHTPLPIHLKYKTLETLGRDRIALAMGAWFLTKKKPTPCFIVDAGTCITMDVLDGNGDFLGGSISPGVQMRLKAMNNFTANLPFVNFTDWESEVGSTTEEALILGAGLGAICEIEGFYHRMKDAYKGLNLILTGGDAEFISEKLTSKIFLQPNLLHIGLREILRYNAN